jgi:hypothetical protein
MYPLSNDGDPPGKKIAQAIGGLLGPVFLEEREQPVQENDDDNRDAKLRHVREDRQAGRDPEHDREEVNELGKQTPPQRCTSRTWKQIHPERLPAPLDVDGGQTARFNRPREVALGSHRP